MDTAIDKSMTMTTSRGPRTNTQGWTDTTVSGLVRVYHDDVHHVYLQLGLTLPTGSIREQVTTLSPSAADMRRQAPTRSERGALRPQASL